MTFYQTQIFRGITDLSVKIKKMLEIALKVDTCPRRFGKCYWRRAKH